MKPNPLTGKLCLIPTTLGEGNSVFTGVVGEEWW